jgi:hypothetical protein
MLSPLLCAALALAAPADEPRDVSAFGMVMEIYPDSPMPGDVAFVKITAFNTGKQAVPAPQWRGGAFDAPTFQIDGPHYGQIGGQRHYHYFWSGFGDNYEETVPPAPLPPGEKRVVFFGVLELPPIGDIGRNFWTELVKEDLPVTINAYLGYRGCEKSKRRWAARGFRFRPRPSEEVAALLEAYAREPPQDAGNRDKIVLDRLWLYSFPAGMAAPEKLAALESKLSDGTLRDVLHAGRLLKIVIADQDHPRGAVPRRAALEELTDLLDARGAELEHQWLEYKALKHLHHRDLLQKYRRRGGRTDEIERELVQALAERLPEFLLDKAAPKRAEVWPFLKQKKQK